KGTFYNLKCKRLLKLMTLSIYAGFQTFLLDTQKLFFGQIHILKVGRNRANGQKFDQNCPYKSPNSQKSSKFFTHWSKKKWAVVTFQNSKVGRNNHLLDTHLM
ncbi:MAG: hypothetical protein Q4F83_12330, partial [Eubacteriales bacterium]|nr:hypothetical protein [Eubacteriales bacterium]